MSTLGPDFVAVTRPTTAEVQAAFVAWFNFQIAPPPGVSQIPNPGLMPAPPYTFAQIQTLLTAAGVTTYALYNALISQVGTGAPSPTVLQNGLAAAIVWTRTSAGVYVGTLANAFLSVKTMLLSGQPATPGNLVALAWTDESHLALKTYVLNAGTVAYDASDDVLIRCPVSILVYP